MGEPDKGRLQVKGLVNLGNSCFFNSAIQCLTSLQCIIQHFRAPIGRGSSATREGPLTAALRAIVVDLTNDDREKVIDPSGLFETVAKAAPRFKGHRQQDAQELLRYLLDAVQEEEKKIRKAGEDGEDAASAGPGCDSCPVVEPASACEALSADESQGHADDTTPSDSECDEFSDEDNDSAQQGASARAPDMVTSLFGGHLLSCVVCKTCGNHSCMIEPFLDVSLPIPGTVYTQSARSWGAAKKGPSKMVSTPARGSGKRKRGRKNKSLSDEALKRADKMLVKLQQEQGKIDALAAELKRASMIAANPDGLCPLVTEDWLLGSSKSALIEWMQKYGKPSMLSKLKISKCLSANKQHHKAADKKQICVCIRAMQKEREEQLMLRICMEKIAPVVATCTSASESVVDPASQTVSAIVDDVPPCVAMVSTPIAPTRTEEIGGAQNPHVAHALESTDGPSELQSLHVMDTPSAAPTTEVHGLVWSMAADDDMQAQGNPTPSTGATRQLDGKSSADACIDIPAKDDPSFVDVLQHGGQLGVYRLPEAKMLTSNLEQTLENCYTLFSKVDTLFRESGNGYACSACRNTPENLAKSAEDASDAPVVFTDAVSRMFLCVDTLPLVMTVHLKRFAATLHNTMTKVSGHVDFPEVFDVAPFCAARTLDTRHPPSTLYRLAGIVVHSGTLGGGHYIAHVRFGVPQPFYKDDVRYEPPCGSEWAYVSDSHTEKSTLQSALAAEAYLLFYEKIYPNS